MISTGVIQIPRRVESFKLYVGNFTCDKLNGVLANFVAANSQGYIVADFVNRKITGVPGGVSGPINLIDGAGVVLLDIPNASMQFEEGAREGAWHTISLFAAHGQSIDGRIFGFRSTGAFDDTSLTVEFGVSDQPGLAGFVDLAKWLMT